MTVVNNTNVNIAIRGNIIKPNERHDFCETGFCTLDIHSDIGSCYIVTEYGKRYITNYGKLVAKEGRKKDKDGMRQIIVNTLE